jgi:hypothetical protein
MLDKFNFYDFLGYLIPGASVVLTIYWVGRWAFGIPFPDLQTDLGSSILFLGISYGAGHLVQGFGGMYEDGLNRRYGGHRLSGRLLLPPCEDGLPERERFSTPLIVRIHKSAKAVFKAADKPSEVFEQCYALVVQQGLAQHTEVFLALNGLCRGMVVASGFGLLAATLVAWKQRTLIDLSAAGFRIPDSGTWSASRPQLVLAIVALAGLVVAGRMFQHEFDQFRSYFAKSVYYNFLAWYGANQLKGKA